MERGGQVKGPEGPNLQPETSCICGFCLQISKLRKAVYSCTDTVNQKEAIEDSSRIEMDHEKAQCQIRATCTKGEKCVEVHAIAGGRKNVRIREGR